MMIHTILWSLGEKRKKNGTLSIWKFQNQRECNLANQNSVERANAFHLLVICTSNWFYLSRGLFFSSQETCVGSFWELVTLSLRWGFRIFKVVWLLTLTSDFSCTWGYPHCKIWQAVFHISCQLPSCMDSSIQLEMHANADSCRNHQKFSKMLFIKIPCQSALWEESLLGTLFASICKIVWDTGRQITDIEKQLLPSWQPQNSSEFRLTCF